MVGYWRDPEATARALDADRWLRTGDIGMVENGRLRLTARRSDLIIRGGENVYPAEIENVLAEYPGLRECVVIGVPHPDLGQEVAAVAVFAGPAPTAEDLAAFARERLAYFKVPSRWHITGDPLPATPPARSSAPGSRPGSPDGLSAVSGWLPPWTENASGT